MTVPKTDIESAQSDRMRRFVVEGATSLGPPGGVRRFASRKDAAGHALAEALFAVAGVQEIAVEEHAVAVLARADASWQDLEEPVRYAIGKVLEPDAGSPAKGPALDDDAMYTMIGGILQREVNPAIAGHGGRIDLLDVQDGVATVRMMGGCHGCGMANVTLRQGVEKHLKRIIPNLRGLEDVTDHASGTNPYFK